ncbi:D-galactonate dehydratase family protein [Colwellia sp. 1_MG-2023]|uniref:D-mannonate dehydratase ManD n=1 Tax=unclassified Colwellia TaxID=196834 RepID=UPI001C09C9FE|nr:MULTISPECIES: D-mannonate dehydratase ManD [unclassified Colwellia]MBU2923340.1 D-galactonate dehydratase family protein [Colwellia sp. C2M11]MDO6653673.1 D-galactonate dehydratase family protein [Colwellia sp. 3_MG-2023]MDO6666484.1 D-galactonate dehydratase family protein [Colwellia sp. 2_MG-2023]MDO6690881.1 D-galactonate dehydratase family protein [Colwellia sp. 1_MG-2023]
MKIKEIKVFVCSPGRNFVTVKVITDEGTYGLGDATVNGREMAVVAYLEEHVVPCLIGRDPQEIEDIWQYLYKGVYWRKGPITMAAIAAIDMALWDIKGKIANLPVYQLLGGKSRKGVTFYAHANGENIDDTLDKAQEHIENGFKAIRLQSAIPGLKVTYGVLGDKKDYFELQGSRPLPPEEEWSTAKYFNSIVELFKKARERFGYEVNFTHDVHSRLTPIEAAKLGKLLEPYNLLFLEDAAIAENQESYKIVRHHTTTPLAIGETYNTIWDCKDLIQNQLIDYIRVAATHAGGITALKRITDFASVYNVKTAPHGAPDLSPVCFAAHMHLNIWAPNFGIQEFVGFGNESLNRIFKHKFTVENGMGMMSEAPGLGVEFDEEAAAEYPYKRSYLPVSRLEDGTLWNW